jgi:uncharacterized C2H2 Zn-finger protein
MEKNENTELETKSDEILSEPYRCQLCGKTFKHYPNYWKHVKKKKTSCITREETLKINNELTMDKSKLSYYEHRVKLLEQQKQDQESEISRLRQMMGTFGDEFDEIKNNIKTIEGKIDEGQELMVSTKFTSAFNNCIINSQNNDNKNLNFSVQLANPEKERMDHISRQQMLYILNNEDFDESVGDFAEAVYFNPKAPENMKWCITDRTAQYGALEYSFETNSLVRKLTNKVIEKHLHNAFFGMTDLLEELRATCGFNERQGINYTQFYNMIGKGSFKPEHITIVKDRAYSGRNFVKALWQNLHLSIDKTSN